MVDGASTALVIEDEPLVLGFTKAILESHGFLVLATESAGAGIHYCHDRQVRIDLVIVDLGLPGVSGTDVALKIWELRPDVHVIFISGTPLEFWTATDRRNLAALPESSHSFLQKPFIAPSLMERVKEALDRRVPLAATGFEVRHSKS